ncbi:MAG: hypothetical protein EOO60_03730 [Hymenobacter sp.]|nr:MAG: hypothetical protein EOO60_03730 [Hymenobacter sp.]
MLVEYDWFWTQQLARRGQRSLPVVASAVRAKVPVILVALHNPSWHREDECHPGEDDRREGQYKGHFLEVVAQVSGPDTRQ